MQKLFATMIILIGWATSTLSNEPQPLPHKLDADGFQDVLAQTGNVFIAGQPSIQGLERMAKQGVKTVISFRTPDEMNDRSIVPFDEAKQSNALGMRYVNIPLGGNQHPYSPEALEVFAKVMDEADGKALIHCTVAWRASHMWAAYLVKHKGMNVNEAAAHGRAVNMGTPPMESLLGGNVTYSVPTQND
ncbi:fused DSP-PTPase phosphatase/NAD kinase-like protein [Kordiimonas aquimaris]|uniref:fused DSP-PTPase phosphatase/NAD kinase-like protein n=1 Tax=Kordiimonas aquimaris TaxID=707591 RepID=UPI0021CE8AD5|nr:sulfur transferase domain-containing protein [Kordiimonas aquimaris]